eukprot:scaffold26567_cov147-Skeletonema_dohrnii-CCMP3373.AAC.1
MPMHGFMAESTSICRNVGIRGIVYTTSRIKKVISRSKQGQSIIHKGLIWFTDGREPKVIKESQRRVICRNGFDLFDFCKFIEIR